MSESEYIESVIREAESIKRQLHTVGAFVLHPDTVEALRDHDDVRALDDEGEPSLVGIRVFVDSGAARPGEIIPVPVSALQSGLAWDMLSGGDDE